MGIRFLIVSIAVFLCISAMAQTGAKPALRADRVIVLKAGGDVFIHGLPNGYGAIGAAHRLRDWTDGCIGVTDEEMDEIWQAVANGTPIDIKA
jgi:hypothetical protein